MKQFKKKHQVKHSLIKKPKKKSKLTSSDPEDIDDQLCSPLSSVLSSSDTEKNRSDSSDDQSCFATDSSDIEENYHVPPDSLEVSSQIDVINHPHWISSTSYLVHHRFEKCGVSQWAKKLFRFSEHYFQSRSKFGQVTLVEIWEKIFLICHLKCGVLF